MDSTDEIGTGEIVDDKVSETVEKVDESSEKSGGVADESIEKSSCGAADESNEKCGGAADESNVKSDGDGAADEPNVKSDGAADESSEKSGGAAEVEQTKDADEGSGGGEGTQCVTQDDATQEPLSASVATTDGERVQALDDELTAMFGEEASKEPAKEHSAEVSDQTDENTDSTKKEDLSQTPDESNLEDMMEAMHADKVAESPKTVQKQSETSGLELKDVLQALTGDGDEAEEKPTRKLRSRISPNHSASGGAKAGKITKARESIESDGSVDRSTRSSKNKAKKADQKKETDKDLEESEKESTENKKKTVRSAKKVAKERDQDESGDEEPGETRKTRSKDAKSKDKQESDVDSSEDEDTAPKKSKRATRKSSSESKTQDKDSSEDTATSKKKPPSKTPVSKSNKVCVVTSCRQQCIPKLGISLHRFPMANNPMRVHWLKLINEKLPGPNTAYMCSKHFKENDYTYDPKKDPTEIFYRKLKPFAIPSIGLPVGADVIEQVRLKVAAIVGGKNPLNVMKKDLLKEVKKEKEVEDKKESEEEAAEGSSVVAKQQKASKSKAPSRSPSPSPSILQPPSKTPVVKKPAMDYKARTPGTNCSVPCCGNNLFETRAEGLNISYYRFPFDEDLASKWIKKIGTDLAARTARICSDHFSEKDFEGTVGGKRNLKPKAVPSVWLTQKKPQPRDSDEESEDERLPKKRGRKKNEEDSKKSKKAKPDTSFITMPLPIIEDIKSEPPSDDEVIGQEYAPQDPGSADEEDPDHAEGEQEVVEKESEVAKESTVAEEVKRGRGRPRKFPLPSVTPQEKAGSPEKAVSLAALSLPLIAVERLGQRVIEAADSGSLRVRIKESADATKKAVQRPRPGPKSMRKRPAESDSETPADEPKKVYSKPGPLSKKTKVADEQPKRPRNRKVLKLSDYEESDEDDPGVPPQAADAPVESASSSSITVRKAPNPVKVKLAELPKFLLDKSVTEGLLEDTSETMIDDLSEELVDAADKSDKEKIIQLVEQRISEHTKIIEGKSMGPQQLADHNKILQGSAMVLKKLAEKTGKPLTASQVISLNVPESGSTPGRTIVLKKVSDPNKLGLKPPTKTVFMSNSPTKTPVGVVSPQGSTKSSPPKAKPFEDDEPRPSTALEKIRDYDNLMKKYLSAVLDKNVMSKKYTESKEAQKTLEAKLQEKTKELELAKRKASTLQAKMNRINTALEYFLTPNQIKLALQETKKVAWSPEEMLTAFTIKHLSKACYLFLRHKLNYPLPGISSLQRWMSMLAKDKMEDDEDNIADDDGSDKEETQEILVEGPGVVNEISGTLEEINAGAGPSEDDLIAEEGGENVKDSNQSSPFQVVFENDNNSNSNRKVIILKKMPNANGKMKAKSKLQISASENDVNVSNIEETDDKSELYRLLPGAKTISMASSPSSPQSKRFVTNKKIKEKEKITFHRLPQVRKEVSMQQKLPRIQMVKSEPQDATARDIPEEEIRVTSGDDVHDVDADETVVKPEDVTHAEHGDGQQKYFTISDLNSTQMEEHVVENVEHMTEDGEIVRHDEGQLITRDHVEPQVVQGGLEELVNMATAGEQQIAFATSEDLARGHFTQIAYTQGAQGEITLHEDINNMTAVVINDIDEEQLNTLLMSNVVEQKGVEIQDDQTYGGKKIVYQTIDNEKNVIVLQPESEAFIEEDEGTSSGAPRVYIINDEGHIVTASGGEPAALAQEIGFIDSTAFAELGTGYSIGNFIENYAIASPPKFPKK